MSGILTERRVARPVANAAGPSPLYRVLLLLRAVALGGVVALVSACVDKMAVDEPGLTEQQRALRVAAGQYPNPDYTPRVRTGETVAMGAILGTMAGALLGAAVGGQRGALIGAAGGAAVGTGGGLAVASAAQNAANQEAALRQSIARANQDARQFAGYAAIANQVAADARVQIGRLEAQYRAGQISSEQYRSQIATYQRDAAALQSLAQAGGRVQGAMNQQQGGKAAGAFGQASAVVGQATGDINAAAADMLRALSGVGQSGPAPGGRGPVTGGAS